VSFRPRRALAVAWKDLIDLRGNRALLASMAVLPVLFALVPAAVVYVYARDPHDPTLRAMAELYHPSFPVHADAAAFLIQKTLTDWFGLFLTLPVFVPILISSQSVAGEKERRTLEPLLATPVTGAELLAGKSLAALLPALALTWLAFFVLCATVDAVAYTRLGTWPLPNTLWLFGLLVIAPLFAFFGNGIAVLISARVSEARLAQQLAGLFVLPMVGLAAGQLGGWLRAGFAYYLTEAAVILALDAALIWAAWRVFDRDRLVSRWR
jgi:ABC-type Na+ efflux pump permease subunit